MGELILNEALKLFKIISTTIDITEVKLNIEEHCKKFTAEELITFVASSKMTANIVFTPSDSNVKRFAQ